MINNESLKPCECGSKNVHVHSEMRHDGTDGFWFWVLCKGCYKSNHFYPSEEAAVAAWNRQGEKSMMGKPDKDWRPQ